MHPFIELFGHTYPTYGFFAALGVIVAFVALELYTQKKNTQFKLGAEMAFLWAVVGALVGAKLLYLFTRWPEFVSALSHASSLGLWTVLKPYVRGGFVFYGGLLGGLLGVILYCAATHKSLEPYLRCFVPLVPLFHIFGRVGCFMEGCCYGVETNGWLQVVFHNSSIAPNNIALVPTQLIEACGVALIFVILLVMRRKKANGWHLLSAYLMLYGALRFILEFFRGDAYRGFVGIWSTSQLMALLTIALALGLIIWQQRKSHNKSPSA